MALRQTFETNQPTTLVNGSGVALRYRLSLRDDSNWIDIADAGEVEIPAGYRVEVIDDLPLSATITLASEEAVDPEVGLVYTTTQLEDIEDAVNTANKYAGRLVWNSTTGLPLWADGDAAGDTWSLATGVATHTPV
jgi:hypothetical protein